MKLRTQRIIIEECIEYTLQQMIIKIFFLNFFFSFLGCWKARSIEEKMLLIINNEKKIDTEGNNMVYRMKPKKK